MIKAKLLNSEAELNDFFHLESLEYVPGENVTVVVQLFNSQKNIRYVPDAAAELTLTFINKDGSELDKAATVLSADDRSMWKVSLSQAETALIAGQNIFVELDEDGDGDPIHKSVLANVMVRTNLSGDC